MATPAPQIPAFDAFGLRTTSLTVLVHVQYLFDSGKKITNKLPAISLRYVFCNLPLVTLQNVQGMS
ncbi:hypothetical protein Vi05172_g9780 [Venturia inaequalis]|nr:hypothetical protein Vi05172_g9780 [Venturia inaequalis]